jgi:hypothetical protein
VQIVDRQPDAASFEQPTYQAERRRAEQAVSNRTWPVRAGLVQNDVNGMSLWRRQRIDDFVRNCFEETREHSEAELCLRLEALNLPGPVHRHVLEGGIEHRGLTNAGLTDDRDDRPIAGQRHPDLVDQICPVELSRGLAHSTLPVEQADCAPG